MSKTIYDAYQEIKQREISELKDAVRNAGGEVEFNEDNAPIVMVNISGGHYSHPADVVITRVCLKDDHLLIDGREKGMSGCAEWLEDEDPIEVDDIAYGHIDFITSEIPNPKKIVISDETCKLCETVAELSQILYDKLYEKYQNSRDVCEVIRELAVKFEESFNEETMDFLEEIDKFAGEFMKNLDKD